MSAFGGKADIRQRIEHVCFVPEADIIGMQDAQALKGLFKLGLPKVADD